MDIKEISSDRLKKKFEVHVSRAVIDQKVEDKIDDASKTFKMAGFRKGCVPIDVMKKMHGKYFIDEVKKEYLSEIFDELSGKMKIASQPSLDIKENDSHYIYELEFEVFPEIESLDIANLKLKIKNPVISDKEIDQEMNNIFERSNTKWVPVNRAVKDGDKVKIAYTARFNKKLIEQKENEIRIGDLDGFDSHIVNKKIGDKLEFDYQYKKDDKEGRLFHYNVEIKEIHEPSKYEKIDDEYLKFFGFDNIEKFKEMIKSRLEHDATVLFVNNKSTQLAECLVNMVKFDVPEAMIANELRYVINAFRKGELSMPNGVDFKNEAGDIDQEKITTVLRNEADKRCRLRLVLNKLGTDFGVKINDRDVERRLKELQVPAKDMTEDLFDNIHLQLFEEKVCEELEKRISIEVEDVDVETFKKWIQTGSVFADETSTDKEKVMTSETEKITDSSNKKNKGSKNTGGKKSPTTDAATKSE